MKFSLAYLCVALCLKSAAGTSSMLRAALRSEADPIVAGGDRILQAELVMAGNNGKPSSAFPLGMCQGDCDSDADCADGLVCYMGTDSTVEGCSGVRSVANGKMNNYCHSVGGGGMVTGQSGDTPAPTPKPQPTPAPTMPEPQPTPKPTPRPTKPQPFCGVEFKPAIDKGKDDVVIRIYEIQGRDRASPYVGQLVYRVPGIVTAIDRNDNRFFFQDLEGDKIQQTSDAVEVYVDGGVPATLAVGDLVIVKEGIVYEMIPPILIQPPNPANNINTNRLLSKTIVLADDDDIDIVASGYPLPPPVYIGTNYKLPPTKDMGAGIIFWSALEAMRVVLVKPIAVTPTLLGDGVGMPPGGDFFAVPDLGQSATGLSQAKTLTATKDDFNPEKIKINEDTGINDFDYPVVEAGDELSDVTGVVEYTAALPWDIANNAPLVPESFPSASYYQITPTDGFRITKSTGNKPTATSCKTGDFVTSVATYNVGEVDLNNPDELKRTAEIIVNLLKNPDVIALQGVPDQVQLGNLVTAIDDIGPTYATAENFAALSTNVFLYNTKFIFPVPGIASSLTTITFEDNGTPFGIPSLAFTFRFETGKKDPVLQREIPKVMTVVNNDWEDKRGSAPSFGTLQPFEKLQEDTLVNGQLARRLIQSNVIRKFIEGAQDVFVTGDFNEHPFISPITNLEYAGLKNLAYDFAPEERYSFIFEGNSVAFDQILVTKDFCPCITAEYIHVNSIFAGPDAPNSDPYHDPMLACIDVRKCPH